jgi:Tfp pilus assembly pilus retraction ATPase PilT
MRDPFPYESNVLLLREIFVPATINPLQWEDEVQRWRTEGHSQSFLEWLIENEQLREDQLLSCMEDHTGAKTAFHIDSLECSRQDPEITLLSKHGFVELPPRQGRRCVAGGPVPGPDLSHYLGVRAHGWEWVMVSPVRNKRQAAICEHDVPKSPPDYGQQAWLRELIVSAWSEGAHDLHFEQSGTQLQVRTHLGQAMRTIGNWPDNRGPAVVRLLESWANLPPGDGRLPRDGHIHLQSGHITLELRVSFLPTVAGMSVVLRSPSSTLKLTGLENLGLPEELATRIIDSILFDPGLILITGSTGSGKTTTLYGIIHELASHNLKILTIEDPVEQIVPFAVQSAVNVSKGWTFDTAIRAYLRQDPDLIMIGEIRDKASAEAATRAALTGHAVISTMHARNREAVLQRLKAWGIPHGCLSESLRMVVHQNLESTSESMSVTPRFSSNGSPEFLFRE